MVVGLAAGDPHRQHDVLRRGEGGSRLNDWKMKPMRSRRSSVRALSFSRGDLGVAEEDLAGRRPVEAGEKVQQRRLAGARTAP